MASELTLNFQAVLKKSFQRFPSTLTNSKTETNNLLQIYTHSVFTNVLQKAHSFQPKRLRYQTELRRLAG